MLIALYIHLILVIIVLLGSSINAFLCCRLLSFFYLIKLSSFCTLKEQKTYLKDREKYSWRLCMIKNDYYILVLSLISCSLKERLADYCLQKQWRKFSFQKHVKCRNFHIDQKVSVFHIDQKSVVIFHIDQKNCRNLP